jgi:diguanylate cyclase
MNEYLIPFTSACTLVTLNYIAVKLRSKMLIESYESVIAPFFTGLACIMMILQPLPPELGLADLRSLPIFMAGLRYGLPVALVSTLIPISYCYLTGEEHWIFYAIQDLIVPALLSSLYHNQEFKAGFAYMRIRNGLQLCTLLFIIRLLFSYYLAPADPWDFIVDQLFLLVLSSATFIVLIIMVNDENKTWMMQRQLELQANQDSLTRLPNLRSFMSIAGNAMRKRKIAIFMVDLDNFKSYNDLLGHLQGDQLLREIGQLLRHSIQEQDYVARYGGEEFILMSTETDPDRLSQYAQRLCATVAAYTQIDAVNHVPPITISIGISVAQQPLDDLQRIIKEADEALYMSKHLGKNRCTYYWPEQTKNVN